MNEQQHFTTCTTCGIVFDLRDLAQVIQHMHEDIKLDPEDLKDVRAREVGDPEEWKDGKKTDLN